MDAARDHLWGQLLIESRLLQQNQLQQLVQERDQRLRQGQDLSLGQLMVQKRLLDVARFGTLRVEIEGRGRACFRCKQIFLVPNANSPATCQSCGGQTRLPPPASSGKFPATGSDRIPGAPSSDRFSNVPGSDRYPANNPASGMGSGQFTAPGTGAFPANNNQYPPGSGAYQTGGGVYQSGANAAAFQTGAGPGAFPSGTGNFPGAAPSGLGSGSYQVNPAFQLGYAGTGVFPAARGGYPLPPNGAYGANPLAAPGSNFVQPPGSTVEGLDELESGELGIGKRFSRYEIQEELGRGGMGVVYKAKDPMLGRSVAVKVLLAGEFASPRLRQRFQEESKLASKLRHPNIVPVHDMGEVDSLLYYTMDYVEGQELQDMIRSKSLPIRRGVEILVDVAHAAHHAHENGVVHRDLKPSNVLVSNDGTPYIMDFGLAKNLEGDKGLTKSGVAIGTPYYMPPEQARGSSKDMDARSDVYALGAILYEVVTRRVPFTAKTQNELLRKIIEEEPTPPRQVRTGIPQDLDTICLKALNKEKDKRYDSALAMAEDLERFLSGEPIKAKPPPPWAGLVRKIKRNQTQSLIIASAALAVIIAAVIIATLHSSHQEAIAEKERTSKADEASDRQELLDWFQARPDSPHPSELEALDVEKLSELKEKKLAEDARRKEEQERQRGRLQRARDRGRDAHTKAREAGLSTSEARRLYLDAESAYSEAVAIEESIKENTPITAYRRALVRRTLCKWELAVQDLTKAAKFPSHKARANLALGIIKLRVFAARQEAQDIFAKAVPPKDGTPEADAREERAAAEVAKTYHAYLSQGYGEASRLLRQLFIRRRLGVFKGEANGAKAFLERVQGKALGGDVYMNQGLRPSQKAVGSDKHRFEFQVDRAILLARHAEHLDGTQKENTLRSADSARSAARNLYGDSEWVELASAVIQAVRGNYNSMRENLETALGKARARSTAAEDVVRDFRDKLLTAVRKKQKDEQKARTFDDDFKVGLEFRGGGNLVIHVKVEPGDDALYLAIKGAKKGDLNLYVKLGGMTKLAQADWAATGPGANERLLIRRDSNPPLRDGIYQVVVTQVRQRGPPVRVDANLFGTLVPKGGRMPWLWESFPPHIMVNKQTQAEVSKLLQRYVMGEPEAAIAGWAAIEKHMPNKPEMGLQRVDWLLETGRKRESLGLVETISRRLPDDPRVQVRLGLLLVSLGKKKQRKAGFTLLKGLLEKYPRILDVHTHLAKAYLARNKADRALKVVTEAQSKHGHPDLTLLAAECLFVKGDAPGGLRRTQQFFSDPATNVLMREQGVVLLRKHNQPKAALVVIEAMLRSKQYTINVLVERARCMALDGQKAEGIKFLEGLMRQRNIPPAISAYLGRVLKEIKGT